jgi:hypothetical protein
MAGGVEDVPLSKVTAPSFGSAIDREFLESL